MATGIDRVEREFILGASAEKAAPARVIAAGRSMDWRFKAVTRSSLSFALEESVGLSFRPWDKVTVYFEFRGQALSFESRVIKSERSACELELPSSVYRGLGRRFPRVRHPRGLGLSLLLPEVEAGPDCPEMRDYADVEACAGSGAGGLQELVEAFKAEASALAEESRVSVFKAGRSPRDFAERCAARSGKAFYLPGLIAGIPIADPYPEGRLLTRRAFEDFAGGAGQLEEFLFARADSGSGAGIWCPVRFFRHCVGIVYLGNSASSSRALGLPALDFAWNFASRLAWFLKRYEYYGLAAEERSLRRGELVDASPAGARVLMDPAAPRLGVGTRLRLRVESGGREYPLTARVARRMEEGGSPSYGLAFEGLDPALEDLLRKSLYGSCVVAEGPA